MFTTRSHREIKLDARMMMKSNPKIIMHSLAYILITYLLSLLYARLSGYTELMNEYMRVIETGGDILDVAMPKVKTTAQVLAGLVYFMSIVIADGYRGYCLLQARRIDAKVRDMIPRFREMVRIVSIELVSAFLVALGTILFIVPGIILMYSYRMAIYVMYDHPEYGVIKCLRESRRMMKGNKWRLFRLDISFIGWYIVSGMLSAFLLPVLDVWLEPYVGISVAAFYNELAGGGTFGADYTITDDEEQY